MDFISRENVENLHRFISTQIRQQSNIDIELDTKYIKIVHKLVERIHAKKNKNFDKNLNQLNKIAIDTIVPFLIKTIEKNRLSSLGTERQVVNVEVNKEEKISAKEVTEENFDYGGLGDNSVDDLDYRGKQSSVFDTNMQLLEQSNLVQDSSYYNDRIQNDSQFFEQTLSDAQLLDPFNTEDELKETTTLKVDEIKEVDHSSVNLIETYDENILVSTTAQQQEASIFSQGTEQSSELGKMTQLTTSYQNFRKEHKMVVLDMYPATSKNNNGAFTESEGISSVICTLEQTLDLSRPYDVYIEYITMHNLRGNDTNKTSFELFHAFALDIDELKAQTYSNLSPFSGKIILPNELFGNNDNDATYGVADANSYVLRLKSNYICRIEGGSFSRFTITLEGLGNNAGSSDASTTLTTMTSSRQSTGVTGLTWAFTASKTITSKHGQPLVDTAHGLSVGDPILFYNITDNKIQSNFIYYVTSKEETTIEISEIPGGTEIIHTANETTTSYVSGKNINSARFQVALLFKER